MITIAPASGSYPDGHPLKARVSLRSPPYFLTIPPSVSFLATVCWMLSMGKIIKICPGLMTVEVVRSLAQRMVFIETPLNIFEMLESVSPFRTTYKLMESGFRSATSAIEPKGPITERRAEEPTTLISPPPWPAKGSKFRGADRMARSWEFAAPRPGDIYRSVGSPQKAVDVMGFRAQVSLADGLKETIDWMR